MSPEQIAGVRLALGLTQSQLAQLLGVHVLTISKWERGVLSPTPYQAAMLGSFSRAQTRKPDVGSQAVALLVGAGIAAAVFALLKVAFDDDDDDDRSAARTRSSRPKRRRR